MEKVVCVSACMCYFTFWKLIYMSRAGFFFFCDS